MLWNARTIANEVPTQLLDRELPAKSRHQIEDVVRACAGVRDIHDLRTRHAGDRIFVEFHLEVDGHLTVDQGHRIGDLGEAALSICCRAPSKSPATWSRSALMTSDLMTGLARDR
jgi:ferrous-iron efflux pump FieF